MTSPVEKLRFIVSLARDARLHATDLRVGIVITDHFNAKHGCAWPSYGRLMECTSLSRASIARSVGRLDALDLIKKVRGGIAGGKKRSNSYRPAWLPPRQPSDAQVEEGDASGGYPPRTGETVSASIPQQSQVRADTRHTDASQTSYYPAKVTKQGSKGGGGSASGGAPPGGARPLKATSSALPSFGTPIQSRKVARRRWRRTLPLCVVVT
jgi:hypothetical protein